MNVCSTAREKTTANKELIISCHIIISNDEIFLIGKYFVSFVSDHHHHHHHFVWDYAVLVVVVDDSSSDDDDQVLHCTNSSFFLQFTVNVLVGYCRQQCPTSISRRHVIITRMYHQKFTNETFLLVLVVSLLFVVVALVLQYCIFFQFLSIGNTVHCLDFTARPTKHAGSADPTYLAFKTKKISNEHFKNSSYGSNDTRVRTNEDIP